MAELQGRKEGSGGQAVHVDTQGTSTFSWSECPPVGPLASRLVVSWATVERAAQGVWMGHGASLAQSHADTVAPSPPTGCPGVA